MGTEMEMIGVDKTRYGDGKHTTQRKHMADTTLTTTTAAAKPPVLAGERGLQLRTLDDYWRLAKCVADSGLAPKGIEKPESILVAIQLGAELGLPPLASLQQIAVINGRPAVYGDAQLAVCRGTGELEAFDEWFEEGGKKLDRTPSEIGDNTAAVCRVKRRGFEPRIESFSVKDAKRASLWGKQGPWSQYPARMLRFRARSFALRDTFGDALRGMRTVEEAHDDPGSIPVETVKVEAGQPVDLQPQQPPKPETKPAEQPKSESVQLGEYLESTGCSIDTFNKWALNANQLEAEIVAWDELKSEVAKRLFRARARIAAECKEMGQ